MSHLCYCTTFVIGLILQLSVSYAWQGILCILVCEQTLQYQHTLVRLRQV